VFVTLEQRLDVQASDEDANAGSRLAARYEVLVRRLALD
jgi:hypothetical protein